MRLHLHLPGVAQVLAPNVLLIPGTSSLRHLEDNIAVADIELDDDTRRQLSAVASTASHST